MNETSNSDNTVGAAAPKATLHLKRPVEHGTVRQSFSHGRSKAVVVEKVKRRILGPGEVFRSPPLLHVLTPTPLLLAQSTGAPAKPISIAPGKLAPAAPIKPAAQPLPKTGVVCRP